MKIGDKVTGNPEGEEAKKFFPSDVTGTYDEYTIEFAGKTDNIQFVVSDGVHIPCSNIRPATRRERETVLNA